MKRNLTILCLLLVTLTPLRTMAGPWTQIPLPARVEVLNALTPGSEYLFAAMQDSSGNYLGLFKTPLETPGEWQSLGLGGFVIRNVIAAGDHDSQILASTSGDESQPRIQYSSNGGATWVGRDQGIPEYFIKTLAWNGRFPGLVYAGASNEWQTGSRVGIYNSSDFGATWNYWSYHSGVIAWIPWIAPQDGGVHARAVLESGFMEAWQFGTTDGGTTWTRGPDEPRHDDRTVDLEISPRDPEEFYMHNRGYIAWYRDGFWINDFGTPFGYSEGDIGLERPAWAPDEFYIAGVYSNGRADVLETQNLAGPWTSIRDGLTNQAVSAPDNNVINFKFKSDPHAPKLFLALFGLGLWMRDMSDVAAVAAGGARRLLSPPMPNPAAGAVSFDITRSGPAIAIQILDANGRVVRTLSSSPGRVTWDGVLADGRRAPAGTYYARVPGGNEEPAWKIILVR